MQLLEVEARHWRGLNRKIGPLSPRLNLILGANESGKSRIFQALRFGLFESYKGGAQHKLLLQSWHANETPHVRIAFEAGGVQYEIQKQYLKGGLAELTGGGATLRGEEAEAQLRTLLGTRPGGTREIGDDDIGIWPLLMVRQGDSRLSAGLALNEHSRSRLQERLASEIGSASISAAGARLLERAAEEYGRYFTATGQEGGVIRSARAALKAAEDDLLKAQAAYAEQKNTASRLAGMRDEFKALVPRHHNARVEAATAKTKADAAQIAAGQKTAAQAQLETERLRLVNAEAALTARKEADEKIQRLEAQIAVLDRQIGEQQQIEEGLIQVLRGAEAAYTAAEAGQRAARLLLANARKEGQRERIREQQRALRITVDSLAVIDTALAAARERRAGLRKITDPQLEELRELTQAARAAASQLSGAAVNLRITLYQALEVDGVSQPAGGQLVLDVVENRRIRLGDVAELEIRPGLGALDQLRAAKLAAADALRDALENCGQDSLEAAITVHAQWRELTADITSLMREAKATSPKSAAELSEETIRLAGELAALGEGDPSGASVDAASEVLESAEAVLEAARSRRTEASAALNQHREQAAAIKGQRESLVAQHSTEVNLNATRPDVDTLTAAAAAAKTSRVRAQEALTAAEQKYTDLGGDTAQADARRLEQAAESLLRRLNEARSEVDKLQGALSTQMAAGSYEGVADAEGRVAEAHVQLTRIERQAGAARRLHQVLTAERRKVVERLTAPVVARIRPYLADLFPGSTLDAGDNLDFTGLNTQNTKEPFDALSGGAQEQLALMTRIGIAEVLCGGHRLPLILDDALVNTDPERIRRVHRALFRAADQLQVLVFSCHDVLYDGLGADFMVKMERGAR